MATYVTGSAGFLGSNLMRSLRKRGDDPQGIDNGHTGIHGDFVHYKDDVRHRDRLMHRMNAQRIYHLACPASPPAYQSDPVYTLETAIIGTRNVLDWATSYGARLVIASTSEVYGEPLDHPQNEDLWCHINPIGARSCYEAGKAAAEALAAAYRRKYGTDVRIARIHNTYGPGMRPDDGRVLSNFITQALRGEPLTIYGTGMQTRSFCYVDELVDGLIRLMGIDDHGDEEPTVVNLGNPHQEHTIRDLVSYVPDAVHGDAVPLQKPRVIMNGLPEDDPTRRRPDTSRAAELLGWNPKISLIEGLPPTVAWFRSLMERG